MAFDGYVRSRCFWSVLDGNSRFWPQLWIDLSSSVLI